MQTFVLAPQTPKKYYVHNDIFRYQDEVFTDCEEEEEEQQSNGTVSQTGMLSHLPLGFYSIRSTLH